MGILQGSGWRKGAMLGLLAFACLLVAPIADAKYCWRDSFGRGIGGIPEGCKDPSRKVDEGLCYTACRAGYDGKAMHCWKNCPSGFRDDGLYCAKPSNEYGRGAGHTSEKDCERSESRQCEKNGLLWYPRCKPGFRAVGCCVCSPECPAGFEDIGVSCKKPGHERGIGTIPDACPSHQEYAVVAGMPKKRIQGREYDAGLCYDKCGERGGKKYDGVGPVCWQQCPKSAPHDCGAGCAANAGECAEAILDMVVSVLDVLSNVLTTITTGGAVGTAKAGITAAGKMAVANAARSTVKGASKSVVKEQIRRLAREAGKTLTEGQLEEMAKASTGQDFDPTSLDPTGIASLVQAYNKPICGAS